MRTFFVAAVLALGAGGACSKSETSAPTASQAEVRIPVVTVEEVDQALAADECVPVDANGDRTRKKLGIVPGAVLLTDSETFSVKELPADKSRPLIFYCANKQCSASEEAAKKAFIAGYTNVKVMEEGIAGWVAAGKKVQNI